MIFRRRALLLSVILLAAFALRVWGLGFGLPFQAHQDEPIVVNHAMAYGSGDLNPHFFMIPPFTSYVLFFAYGVMFLIGKLFGAWGAASEFARAFFLDPSLFYVVGRFFIGVIPGTLCVGLTFRLASLLLDERGALYAAAIMAFSFLNVVNSHYIYTDMLLMLVLILGIIVLVKFYRSPSIMGHVVCGALIGLAAGVKYNGVLLAATYAFAFYLSSKRDGKNIKGMIFSPGPVLAAASASAVFVLVNPFSVISPSEFAGSFIAQSGCFWYTGPLHHFFYSLSEGISLPLTLAGMAGLVLISLGNDKGRIFVSFPAVYYALIVFRSQHFSRYVLPLVPFFAVGAAYFLLQALPHFFKSSSARRVCAAAAIFLLVPTAVKSVKADFIFSSTDTRIVSARWIHKNLPPGERLAFDSTVHRPALRQPASQLEAKKEHSGSQEGLGKLKGEKLRFMIEAAGKRGDAYPLYFMYRDPVVQGQFLDTLPALPFDVERLKEEGIRYVVVNSQENHSEKELFLEELEASADKVMEFSPYDDGIYRESFDRIDATCIPVSDRELFSRRKLGPAIRVYRLKQ
ncbi:MAG: glycosyltransferase family 39 protein [Candidatus Omnitrophica bacterium]|nr:glycosyltransferase family 39 protein [Candidatus Omnitrophota bacterium]